MGTGSFRLLDGFRFRDAGTVMHRMDPRAKMVLVACFFAGGLLLVDLLAVVAVLLLQVPFLVAGKVVRRWLVSLQAGALFAVLIFVLNWLTGFTVFQALALTVRFLALVSSFSLFFMTTSPDDLGLALQQLGVPYSLAFTFTTAVRLVPTLAVDAYTVMDAQRSRGLELDRGNLLRRVRNLVPILIPLLVIAIRRSVELAEALEARAFGSSKTRTSLYELRLETRDALVIAGSLAVLTGAILYHYGLWPGLLKGFASLFG